MQENNSFISFDNNKKGLIFDDSKHKEYPIRYYNVIDGDGVEFQEDCSYYGFVYDGCMSLMPTPKDTVTEFDIQNGMFFSLNGKAEFDDYYSKGKCVVIEILHTKGVYPQTKYKAYFNIGGPLESQGRLKYIDGCTDSCLISPIKLGDPCLNHLHFPSNITQTQHTHPSHRIGIVSKGEGECITPFGNLPLTTGMIFVIKEWDGKSYGTGLDGKEYPVGQHSFNTKNNSMDVIAFHPDSDFGATDVVHPMINRTYVDGKSVNTMDEIMTNEEQFNNQD